MPVALPDVLIRWLYLAFVRLNERASVSTPFVKSKKARFLPSTLFGFIVGDRESVRLFLARLVLSTPRLSARSEATVTIVDLYCPPPAIPHSDLGTERAPVSKST